METITFKTEEEFFDAIFDSEEFGEYRSEELSNFDSEKGFVDVTVYLERQSDGKRFTAGYTRGGQGNRWVDDLTFEEVKQKVKKPKSKKPKSKTYSETEVSNLFKKFSEHVGCSESIAKKFLQQNKK